MDKKDKDMVNAEDYAKAQEAHRRFVIRWNIACREAALCVGAVPSFEAAMMVYDRIFDLEESADE
jgi:hypothetical protein